jgi:23S rRNA (uracil1939-C5)-methyltransferase
VSCPHAAACAGCPLIDLPADEQRLRKQARVARATGRFPTVAAVAIEPLRRAEPEVAYRTRAKLVVAPGPRLGLYGRLGDHVVVDIPDCRVLAPSLHAVAAALRTLLADPPPETAPALRPPVLRAVDLREALAPDGAARVLVTLVLDAGAAVPAPALQAAADAIAARAPAAASIAASFQAADAPQLLGRDLRVLRGPPLLPDVLGEDPALPFVHATHGGFVQVHRDQAARIRALVAGALETALGGLSGRAIVDAYAGSGATGLALAAKGARAILIESHPRSVDHARAAAASQHLDVVEVMVADVADGLEALARAARPIDAVVLNPPRRGVSPRVRASGAALARTAILYVSCDPDTLARDLDHFTRLGWATDALVPFDMLPQTAEVETVTLLLRRAPSAPVILYADDELVAADKSAHEPTVPPPRDGGSCLLERVRSLPGLGAAVALAPLDAGTSGVCLFARTPAAAPGLGAALGAKGASAEYEALCRGETRPDTSLPPARLRRLQVIAGHSLVALSAPPTGTRALRRALARLGHPVLGDEKNGHAPSNRHLLERHGLDRPFLHCARVSLVHPRTGVPVVVSSPLPGELRMVLDRLARKSQCDCATQHRHLAGG